MLFKLTVNEIEKAESVKTLSRSPAVARRADRTAPVIKLTLTLTLILPGPRE